MRVAVLLITVGFAGVFASEQIWMDLMSTQIADAIVKDVSADRNIPQLASDLGLDTLVNLTIEAGLVDALSGLGPFTVFGPTDKAFGALPPAFVDLLKKNHTLLGEILKYHVVSANISSSDLKNDLLTPSLLGSNIRINLYKDNKVITASGRQVTLPDQEASNGVIHEVNGVLLPPPGTITAVVKKCPALSTLDTAISKVPDIFSVLDGKGPFTLFAPSNEAFAEIPKKCLDALLKNTTLLTKVLEYHVVPSTEYSAGLSCGDKLKTVEGDSVKVTIMCGRIYIDHSHVTYADGTTTNGVIHVIGKVLLPKVAEDFCDEINNGNDKSRILEKGDSVLKPFFVN